MSNLTPNGNPSLKPARGRSWKRTRKIDIVARLEAKFVSDQEIADLLQMTVANVQSIKNTPEYKSKRVALANNELALYEQAVLSSDEGLKDKLDSLIPRAILGIEHILGDRTHPHFAKVATDLLDRSRATSKISRTEHSVAPVKHDSEKDRQAQELMGLLEPDKTINDPNYDPTRIDPFGTPNPYKKLPEFVPLPDQDPNPDPSTIVPTEELDEAIEKNTDVNDLIM
jgi:FtsZ-binding cell division protein ZapB